MRGRLVKLTHCDQRDLVDSIHLCVANDTDGHIDQAKKESEVDANSKPSLNHKIRDNQPGEHKDCFISVHSSRQEGRNSLKMSLVKLRAQVVLKNPITGPTTHRSSESKVLAMR
jgi:hypothetical protein